MLPDVYLCLIMFPLHSFNNYIYYVKTITFSQQNIGFLNRIKNSFSSLVPKTFYSCLILPHRIYGLIILGYNFKSYFYTLKNNKINLCIAIEFNYPVLKYYILDE